MAKPKYRVIDTKGAYMPRTPDVQLLALGADHAAAAVYGIRAPVFELLPRGTVIDYDGPPGPHLEPLNDEAIEAMKTYWEEHPGATLDPTRRMPLGQDPMGGRSIEQLVGGLLDAMDREQTAAAIAPAGDPGLAAAMKLLAESTATIAAGQATIQAALAALLQQAAANAAPPPAAGKGNK